MILQVLICKTFINSHQQTCAHFNFSWYQTAPSSGEFYGAQTNCSTLTPIKWRKSFASSMYFWNGHNNKYINCKITLFDCETLHKAEFHKRFGLWSLKVRQYKLVTHLHQLHYVCGFWPRQPEVFPVLFNSFWGR